VVSQISSLLVRLQKSKNPVEKRKLRRRLRLLGHKGGLKGKKVKVKKSKSLTSQQKKKIAEHNKEVTRRIETKEYKPFYPYIIKCRRCGYQDAMAKNTNDLSHLVCSKCKGVGTFVYLKRSKAWREKGKTGK